MNYSAAEVTAKTPDLVDRTESLDRSLNHISNNLNEIMCAVDRLKDREPEKNSVATPAPPISAPTILNKIDVLIDFSRQIEEKSSIILRRLNSLI